MPKGRKEKPFPRTMTQESEALPLWEFHEEWESKAAFSYFEKYFLPQPPNNRTLTGAVRAYLIDKGRLEVANKLGYKSIEAAMKHPHAKEQMLEIDGSSFKAIQPSGIWQKMHRAIDKLGKRLSYIDTKGKEHPVPNWEDRAEAFDRFQRFLAQQEMEEMRKAEIQRELHATDLLWNVLESMIQNAPAVVVSQEVEEPELDEYGNATGRIRVVQTVSLDPTGMTQMLRSAGLLSNERRRALGMPTEINETRVSGVAGGPPITTKTEVTLSMDEKLKQAKKRLEEWERHEKENPPSFEEPQDGEGE